MIRPFTEPIYVTRPVLPPLEAFNARMAEVWSARWLTNAGDYSGQRHSPLKQITPANASQLAPQWTFQTGGVTGQFEATPIVVNRLLTPYMVDAIRTLQEGLGSISALDSAMQLGANHPLGPLALADFIGLDIVFHMASNLFEEYREPRLTPPPLLRRLVLAGYLGRKSSKGFYDYSTTPPTPNDWLVGTPS